MTKRTQLETVSGRYLDFEAPRREDVSLDDIAHALSNVCRWGGHCPQFYSIAEHACLVHDIVMAGNANRGFCDLSVATDLALAALHHDDHEAFLGDVPTPLKNVLGEPYYSLADRLDEVIASTVGLSSDDWFDHQVIKDADRLALYVEAARFKPSQGRTWEDAPPPAELPRGVVWACGLSPAQARQEYLRRHQALS